MTEAPPAHDQYRTARDEMVRQIMLESRTAGLYSMRDELSARVLEVMRKVPRHRFVPAYERGFAYANRPLPIGHGQTISQPFIVALMTDLLALEATDTVLEVGTGCGYQTAVLAEMAAHVYTVEVVPELARAAAATLRKLGYANVSVARGDGNRGWPGHAPYDKIIVTAVARQVPPALRQQLATPGRIVLPLGVPYGAQMLTVVQRGPEGQEKVERVLPVAFVPLVSPKT